jgi:hypothetical protein
LHPGSSENLWDNPGKGGPFPSGGLPASAIIAGKWGKENRPAIENGWNRDLNGRLFHRCRMQTFAGFRISREIRQKPFNMTARSCRICL